MTAYVLKTNYSPVCCVSSTSNRNHHEMPPPEMLHRGKPEYICVMKEWEAFHAMETFH